MNEQIAALRKDYRLKTLNEEDVATTAIQQFGRWWTEAVTSEIDEVNAMTLATATPNGIPSARIVLLKSFDETGFTFFTNYNSVKGKMLEANAKAALVFFWKELERQVRIEGDVVKLSSEESDTYFNSRPVGSRIGAWASPQSAVIPSRHVLEENVEQYVAQFKEGIPRPPHWGGYIVKPLKVEFWQGRSNRLHDRILYTLQPGNNTWKVERLAP
ncbi:pyridoxamine 5'-phosphate oxidase [Ilyomonas limi]|uniref:Pyridoxine/pyridoxamine 5'-phosphate oxidase n=1 Tax=Ilyomonas limi TaxID=2575867 RepID=A0A4U3L8S7_9BACT|nr:pyridoxamine 5'-phosphate oxidase [Ilyomonas limi]TKK71678.1 pyridoxamine 5'-phosphate oxidase [Ilyomonas limi]